MRAKLFFFKWWPFIVGFFLLVALSVALDAQEPAKFVEKIDYAHVLNIQFHPGRLIKEGETYHMTCLIFVFHDDKTVYRQTPYDGIIDPADDTDFAMAFHASFNACRDRVIEILMEARHYEETKAKNTLPAKHS